MAISHMCAFVRFIFHFQFAVGLNIVVVYYSIKNSALIAFDVFNLDLFQKPQFQHLYVHLITTAVCFYCQIFLVFSTRRNPTVKIIKYHCRNKQSTNIHTYVELTAHGRIKIEAQLRFCRPACGRNGVYSQFSRVRLLVFLLPPEDIGRYFDSSPKNICSRRFIKVVAFLGHVYRLKGRLY